MRNKTRNIEGEHTLQALAVICIILGMISEQIESYLIRFFPTLPAALISAWPAAGPPPLGRRRWAAAAVDSLTAL